jgi:hypothetical protein
VLVRPDEKVTIARLLSFLEYGERLAQDCASKQDAATGEVRASWFLKNQARQEGMHAYVFKCAIAWLAPRQSGNEPFLPALEAYRKKLYEAFTRRDVLETFLAEQIILEGLGEAILNRIEAELQKRAAPFGRLRRVLLHQEEAHYAFGERMIDRAVVAGEADLGDLRQKAQDYLALTQTMVLMLVDLLDAIDEDPAASAADIRGYLPNWLVQEHMTDT